MKIGLFIKAIITPAIDNIVNIIAIRSKRFFSFPSVVSLYFLFNVLSSLFRFSSNPFASGNPFVHSHNENPFATYGQNKPVIGGYFAGYYNNQPNIVGRRLFIEA